MCGIVVAISTSSAPTSVDAALARRMLAAIAHRGPDDTGIWSDGRVTVGHNRLAVQSRDANPQPLVLDRTQAREPLVLAFNGELYDLPKLRADLRREGVEPRTSTDTELFGLALAMWGDRALTRVRGMFACVAYFPERGEVLVARDALGVVPIYFGRARGAGCEEVIVASEPSAILAHPRLSPEPDWEAVSNYVVTLRPTVGVRTLFRDVFTVEPGCLARIRVGEVDAPIEYRAWWRAPSESACNVEEAIAATRDALVDSVEAHLVADMAPATLLSGGIDSVIVTTLASRSIPNLRTFCTGACDGSANSDLDFARRAAASIGTNHLEVIVDEARFASHWPWMINRLGMPLSTPNEIAIHAVAEAIRPHTNVVLSGEGADELFAGYEQPLIEAERWIASGSPGRVEEWHADTFSWVPRSLLREVFTPAISVANESAHITLDHLRGIFLAEGDPRSLRTHLSVQRRLNLPTLLHRLNTATMLASVEGRTPFADIRVAETAARIPMAHLLAHDEHGGDRRAGGVAVATLPRTKRALRSAFADIVDPEVLVRPKASFPLPFDRWMQSAVPIVESSTAARLAFSPAVFALLRGDLAANWRLAWPILNVGLWLRRWWG
jgi:asparagine synthase (glutamine-hydrolysing)